MCQLKHLSAEICRPCRVLFALALFWISGGTPASAQISVGPAPGTTPILSPYLDLLRIDGGVLPNYQQFVRPRLQLRSTIAQQQREIQRQRESIQSVNRRVSSIRDPRSLTTGVRSGFMQYSTFYPTLQRR